MAPTVARAGHWKSPNSSSVIGALISPRTCSGFIVLEVALDGAVLFIAVRFARYSTAPAPIASTATAATMIKGRYRFMLGSTRRSVAAQVKPGRRRARRHGEKLSGSVYTSQPATVKLFALFRPVRPRFAVNLTSLCFAMARNENYVLDLLREAGLLTKPQIERARTRLNGADNVVD